MPSFYLDVEIDEFVDDLSPSEIIELIDYLKEEGHINRTEAIKNVGENLLDNMWFDTCRKIINNKLLLTIEEIEIIENIAKRF